MLLAALICYVCFALKALKLPVFSYELTLLTFRVSYLGIISYIYIYIRSAFYVVFSVRRGGGGSELRFSVLLHHRHYLCFQC